MEEFEKVSQGSLEKFGKISGGLLEKFGNISGRLLEKFGVISGGRLVNERFSEEFWRSLGRFQNFWSNLDFYRRSGEMQMGFGILEEFWRHSRPVLTDWFWFPKPISPCQSVRQHICALEQAACVFTMST